MKKMLKKVLFTSVLFSTALALAPSAEAREWTIVGPRALGMGGAGVAVANDSTASYWNPAAFGFFNGNPDDEYGKRDWSATLDAGFGVQVHEDLGEQIDILSKMDFSQFTSGSVTTAQVPDFIESVSQLKTFADNPDRALTIAVNGGVMVQAGNFGLNGYGFSDISARGDLDLVNIGPTADATPAFTVAELTDPATYGCGACATTGYFSSSERTQLEAYLGTLGWTTGAGSQAENFINIVENGVASLPPGDVPASSVAVAQIQNTAAVATAAAGASGGTIDNNASKILFKGLAVAEVPLTYGRKITDGLAVGGSVKFMTARTYNIAVDVFNQDFGDALSTATDTYSDSNNFGVDLGALYRAGDVRFGVVARNINSPSFDITPLPGETEDTIDEKPQVRAGVAYRPFGSVIVAADIDLTENETTVSGTSTSRLASLGIEGNVFNILQLRGGIYKNLANDDIGPVYTAGLGLNLWAVNLDFGAAISSGSTTVDGNDIPKEVRAELALSALF